MREGMTPEELFTEAFFSDSEWFVDIKRLVLRACIALDVQPDSVWEMFLDCLVLRTSYFKWRKSAWLVHHINFIRLAAAMKDKFVLPVNAR